MSIPKYFTDELATLDKTYRVESVPDGKGFYIVKDMDLTMAYDGGSSLYMPGSKKAARIHGPLVILWVPELGGVCLDKLREMKRRALTMKIYENPMAELAFYQAQKREASRRRLESAVDIITEGLMVMDKLMKSKSWSYGGSGKEKTNG